MIVKIYGSYVHQTNKQKINPYTKSLIIFSINYDHRHFLYDYLSVYKGPTFL